MRAAVFIALKDLRLLSRDRVALFWVLGFPLAFALLFGSVMSSALDEASRRISVVVVADDRDSPLAKALSESDRLDVRSMSLEDAQRAVRHGRESAYLRLPESGEPVLGVDPARASEVALLKSEIARAARGSSVEALPMKQVKVGAPNRSPFDLAFPAAVLWGLMGCAATFAVSMVSERTSGTHARLGAAPISQTTILIKKTLACFAACLLDALLLLALGKLVLGVSFEGVAALSLAVLATAVCFVGITMLLSMLGTTEQSVAGAGWATLILLAMIGGAMVPLAAMPSWLLPITDISPVKWGILALEGASWRSFSVAELLYPCAILVGIGTGTFALGLGLLAQRGR